MSINTSRTSTLSADRPIAMLTGATKRVGLASARAIARCGFDLLITYKTSLAQAEQAADELRTLGSRVVLKRIDLSDLEAVDRAARALAQDLPRLDVLVHNASSYEQTPLQTLSPQDILEAYTVNAASPLLLSRGLSELLTDSPRTGGGSIVAMADIHALGEHGLPRKRDYSAYAMSKAALVEMIRTLARELAPRVRVNAVAPGVVIWPTDGPEASATMQDSYLKQVPLSRAGTAAEAAEVVRWLAIDATYITGQVVRIDGGRSLV